jgi:hypothetical protein
LICDSTFNNCEYISENFFFGSTECVLKVHNLIAFSKHEIIFAKIVNGKITHAGENQYKMKQVETFRIETYGSFMKIMVSSIIFRFKKDMTKNVYYELIFYNVSFIDLREFFQIYAKNT